MGISTNTFMLPYSSINAVLRTSDTCISFYLTTPVPVGHKGKKVSMSEFRSTFKTKEEADKEWAMLAQRWLNIKEK